MKRPWTQRHSSGLIFETPNSRDWTISNWKKKPFGIETANQTIFQIFYRSCLILGTFMRGDPGLNYYWDSIYLATPSHLKTAASPPISSRTIQWVVRSWGMWQSGDMAVSQMKETLTLELQKPRKYRQFVSLQGNLSYISCPIYLDSWLALTKVHEDMHGASNTARRQFSLLAWVPNTSSVTARPSRNYFNLYVDRTKRKASWNTMHFPP